MKSLESLGLCLNDTVFFGNIVCRTEELSTNIDLNVLEEGFYTFKGVAYWVKKHRMFDTMEAFLL